MNKPHATRLIKQLVQVLDGLRVQLVARLPRQETQDILVVVVVLVPPRLAQNRAHLLLADRRKVSHALLAQLLAHVAHDVRRDLRRLLGLQLVEHLREVVNAAIIKIVLLHVRVLVAGQLANAQAGAHVAALRAHQAVVAVNVRHVTRRTASVLRALQAGRIRNLVDQEVLPHQLLLGVRLRRCWLLEEIHTVHDRWRGLLVVDALGG